MKRILALMLAVMFSIACFSGCGHAPTEEELQAQKLAEMEAEEASTGRKRMTSVNLEDCEIVLREFVEGIQADDTEKVAGAVGSPNVFGESDLYGWALANGYEGLQKTPLEDIQVRTEKNGAIAKLFVYIGVTEDEMAVEYSSVYEGGRWILVPPQGVAAEFTFTAPTKHVSCGETDLTQYAKSAGENSYTWTFVIPRMIELENPSDFLIKSNLGEFSGKMFNTIRDGYMLLVDLTDEQKTEFEGYATAAFQNVFELLQSGASTTEVSQLLLAEETLRACFPTGDAAKEEYAEKLKTVTGVSMNADDAKDGYPAEYTYRLAGEDGIIMDTKLLITTSVGECRKKATVTMQNYGGVWKIVKVVCTDNSNPFVDFEAYDPAW